MAPLPCSEPTHSFLTASVTTGLTHHGALQRVGAAILVGLAVLLISTAAAAHGRSVSYSSWEIDAAGADVSLRLKLLELSRIGPEALPPGMVPNGAPAGSPDLPARAFPTELVLFADGSPCLPTGVAARRPDQPGWVRYEWRVECSQDEATLKSGANPGSPGSAAARAERLSIHSQILLAVAPSHMHFARVRFAEASEPLREQVLTEATPQFVVRDIATRDTDQAALGSSFLDYVALGIEHIMSGWDHLAFVFGLLLLATRLGDVARLVTGFTLAHSLTLALAVLELVHPRAAAVEAVIAFSVTLVAIEKGWLLAGRPRAIPRVVLASLAALGGATLAGFASLPLLTTGGLMLFTACYFALVARQSGEWLRVCLTFAFGLVHGFGFAGILVEMTLPADRLVPALLGFNLGVEAGQIAVILALWPLLWTGRRFASESLVRWGGELAAAGLCGLGVFWIVERVFSV